MPSEANGYSEQELSELRNAYIEIQVRGLELSQLFLQRSWSNLLAREHAHYGFCRRTKTLVRCIQNTFELIPPEQKEPPQSDTLNDTEINLQAFLFNEFGALDNLAWIIASEKGLKRSNGKPLNRLDVGLGQRQLLRKVMPASL